MKSFYSYNNGTARLEGFLPKNLSPTLLRKKVDTILGKDNEIRSISIFEATDWNKKSCHNIRLKTDDPSKVLYLRIYGLTETKIINLKNKFNPSEEKARNALPCLCTLNPLFCKKHA
jgi:hypothetical protein